MAKVSPSFDLGDSKDFPTLGSEPADFISSKKKITRSSLSNEDRLINSTDKQQKEQDHEHKARLDAQVLPSLLPEISGDYFVAGRIGIRHEDYRTDLAHQLERQHESSDFIIIPISRYISPQQVTTSQNTANDTLIGLDQIKSYQHQFLPDLILSREDWQSKIIVELTFPLINDYHAPSIKLFEDAFRHALYLEVPVILITCPRTEIACVTIASLVNNLIPDRKVTPSILLKLPFIETPYSDEDWNSNCNEEQQEQNLAKNVNEIKIETADSGHNSCDSNDDLCHSQSNSSSNSNTSHKQQAQSWTERSYSVESPFMKRNHSLSTITNVWDQWCAFRSHVNPLRSIGVCLELVDEIINDYIGGCRWMGEPVRLVIVKRHHFTILAGEKDQRPALSYLRQDFLTQTILANSLKVGLVLDPNPSRHIGRQNYSIANCIDYLDRFYEQLVRRNNDSLRPYDNDLLLPLQPLSSNLTSDTYATFEKDKRKYQKYKSAMVEALKYVEDMYGAIRPKNRPVILMVLGAGRGPLVDCFIKAIEELSYKSKVKIFALDKNTSSVVALRHKLNTSWRNRGTGDGNLIEIEVVESDMRAWDPQVKADIIATEMLGSFGCNELSPECIDGLWKFSTERTISIPREYTSYIHPITSYKIYQNISRRKHVELDKFAFDRIYVCKLQNVHAISEPKALFGFSHLDVSEPPCKKSTNERYMRLNFTSSDNTICHGFGGYFRAALFGTKFISTVPESKTSNMESWFPAFIPLECPIEICGGETVELHFWRKTSSTSVWYEWLVTQPSRSRLHSLMADGQGMSKVT